MVGTVARFERLTAWAVTGVQLSVSELDAALKRCHNLLNKDIAKRQKITVSEFKKSPSFKESPDDELEAAAVEVKHSCDGLREHSHKVQTLIRRLDQAGFSIRLKKQTGATRLLGESRRGAQRNEFRKALHTLASEALAAPSLLTDDEHLMAWLCSDEAKKADIFFEELGKLDTEHRFIDMIKHFGILDTPQSVQNSTSYFIGVNEIDQNFVSAQLDDSIKYKPTYTTAILKAMTRAEYSAARYARIKQLLNDRVVSPSYVAQLVWQGPWITKLSERECYRLIRLVAGPTLQNASLVVYYVNEWHNVRHSIGDELARLAWSCFEAMPSITHNEAYNFDRLADILTKKDSKRGFSLLKRALEYPQETLKLEDFLQPVKQPWDPLSLYEQHVFWDTLWEPDHEFALRFVLQIGLNNQKIRYRIKSGLLRVINQDRDADVLIALARENQNQAELICHCLTTYEKPNFCKIAFGILDSYPRNEKIESALISAFHQLGGGYFDESRRRLKTQLEGIANLREDPDVSPPAIAWIDKLEPTVQHESEFLIDNE